MSDNEPFYPIEQGQGWSAACTQAFCSDRDWKAVNSFYATQVIAGDAALEALGIALIEPPPPPPPLPPLPAGQLAAAAARVTFKIHLGYYGPAFTGWQWSKQAGSVEQAVRTSLEHLLQQRALADGGGAGRTSQPPAVVVSVAGRTDRGVNAVGQVASFYTFDSQLPPQAVLQALNAACPGQLRAWHVQLVPRSFHATFQAKWRRYLYLFPLRSTAAAPATTPRAAHAAPTEPRISSRGGSSRGTSQGAGPGAGPGGGAEVAGGCRPPLSEEEAAALDASAEVDPARVDALLRQLEGRQLDYGAFARGTAAGQQSYCTLHRARAWHAFLPDDHRTPVMAVELVGDRFLRRMVRVLVATAVREALPGAAWFVPPATAAAEEAAMTPAATTAAAGARAAAGEATAEGARAAAGEGMMAARGAASAMGAASSARKSASQPSPEPPAAADGALLWVAATGGRRVSAAPAPAEGLCFVEAGYSPLQL